jgi:hypothetical protein
MLFNPSWLKSLSDFLVGGARHGVYLKEKQKKRKRGSASSQ